MNNNVPLLGTPQKLIGLTDGCSDGCQPLLWSSVSQLEVEQGIAVVALISLLLVLLDRSGFSFLLRSKILRKHLGPPGSYLSLALATVGTVSFTLLVLCNMQLLNNILDINHLDIVQYPLRIFGFFFGSAMGANGTAGYGALTLLVWVLTIFALSMSRGFAGALKMFAIPSILFLTVVVLLFDPGEMDVQAVNIVSGITYDGISLISNWFLFTVSLFLTVFEVIYASLGMKKRLRLRQDEGVASD